MVSPSLSLPLNLIVAAATLLGGARVAHASDCPCWTATYLEETEAYLGGLEAGDLERSATFTFLGDGSKGGAQIGPHPGTLGNYSLAAQKLPNKPQKDSSTLNLYQCHDRAQDQYLNIQEEEFHRCLEDILDVESRIGTQLCRAADASNEADSCPCWPNGIETTDVAVFQDEFSLGVMSSAGMSADLQFVNEDQYIVDGGSCTVVLNGVETTKDSITNQQSNKCFNDILRSSCSWGMNPCAAKSRSCRGDYQPSAAPTMGTPTVSPLADEEAPGADTESSNTTSGTSQSNSSDCDIASVDCIDCECCTGDDNTLVWNGLRCVGTEFGLPGYCRVAEYPLFPACIYPECWDDNCCGQGTTWDASTRTCVVATRRGTGVTTTSGRIGPTM